MDKRGGREGRREWLPCSAGDEGPGEKPVETGLPTSPTRELWGNGGARMTPLSLFPPAGLGWRVPFSPTHRCGLAPMWTLFI